MTDMKRILTLVGSLCAFFIVLIGAEPATANTQQETIARVEYYLSNLNTAVADFVQSNADGTLSSGKFFLKRPKQMRWQYNPPTPVLMVTRGNYLTYYDYELEQVSDIPLDNTLLGVLAKKRVSFTRDNIIVSQLQQEPGFIRITLEQKNKPEEGSLTLDFADAPMKLRGLHIVDTTGQRTDIAFENMQLGVPLSENVFEFKDPRVGGRRKKSGF